MRTFSILFVVGVIVLCGVMIGMSAINMAQGLGH